MNDSNKENEFDNNFTKMLEQKLKVFGPELPINCPLIQ